MRSKQNELPAEEYFSLRAFKSSQNKIAMGLFFFIAIEAVCALIAGMMMLAMPEQTAEDPVVSELFSAAMYLGVFLSTIAFLSGSTGKKFSLSSGLRPRLPRRPLCGIFLCLAVFNMGNVLSYFADLFWSGLGFPEAPGTVSFSSDAGIGLLLLSLFSTALLPAILEEILFRGLILGELSRYGRSIAVIFSGALFGLVHRTTSQILFAALGGILLAYFVLESGSILFGMIVHFINNAVAVLSSFAALHLSNEAYFAVFMSFDLLIFALGILSAVRLFRRESVAGPLPPEGDNTWLCRTEPERVTARGSIFSILSGGTVAFAVTALLYAVFTLYL